MKSELVEKASAIITDSQLLINIISRRVNQLTDNKSPFRSPLVPTTPNMSTADIALTELIEGKLVWNLNEPVFVESDDFDYSPSFSEPFAGEELGDDLMIGNLTLDSDGLDDDE